MSTTLMTTATHQGGVRLKTAASIEELEELGRKRPFLEPGLPAPASLSPRHPTPTGTSQTNPPSGIGGHPGGAPTATATMTWVGLVRPDPTQVAALARTFGWHELLVEDLTQANPRPKLERYGQTLFLVLRPAIYRDDTEEVQFGEIHVVIGPGYAVTLRHADAPDLARVRGRVEGDPDLLALGPKAVMYACADAVVDAYSPVATGLEQDIEEIEVEVFSGTTGVSRRIYELSQEVADFQRAIRSTRRIVRDLIEDGTRYRVPEGLTSYLGDVQDHIVQLAERVDQAHASLRDILIVNGTLTSQRQNEEMRALSIQNGEENEQMRRISAWAAVALVPTLLTGVWGMNFTHMPELHWAWAYPAAMGVMVVASFAVWLVFKRKRWI
ncbi:MAG: magnesium and cobalt transport protein CorA [Bifidobacteriaceae bacterium]|nr:magnesium and cobalt transport protein CorA [Bifidobacteriaceae bacterium]